MDWSNLFVMFVTFVLINNVVLNQFLGMCPFMGVSKKSSSAIGMGAAVYFRYRRGFLGYVCVILRRIR